MTLTMWPGYDMLPRKNQRQSLVNKVICRFASVNYLTRNCQGLMGILPNANQLFSCTALDIISYQGIILLQTEILQDCQ